MDSTFCIECGHPESDHSAGGWHGKRCLAYPGECGCEMFAPMSDPYEAIDAPASERGA